MRVLLRAMASRPVAATAIRVALVVGTILNLINQGDALIHMAGVEWDKVALNYLTPYLVASYSAARARLAIARMSG